MKGKNSMKGLVVAVGAQIAEAKRMSALTLSKPAIEDCYGTSTALPVTVSGPTRVTPIRMNEIEPPKVKGY